MNQERKQLLVEELTRQLVLFSKAIYQLQQSFEVCSKTKIQPNLSDDKLTQFEALTSRFARGSDLLTQKIFRLIDTLELEERGSLIDRINRAEKRGVIASAEAFLNIRDLRNRIAHEYTESDLTKLFEQVLELSPILIASLESVEQSCKKYL